MFSQRSQFGREPNRLERARATAVARGRELFDLTESNPTRAELPRPDVALAALAHPAAHRYDPEPFGLREARTAVSAYMAEQGITISTEDIVLTASTSEAYAFLFKLLCDPGDEVLIPAPSYPLFEQLARLEAVQVAEYPLRYDGRWHIALPEIESARSPRTRALITLHPNNPTGSYLKRGELAALASLGLPLISDEVFAPYSLSLDEDRVRSALVANTGLIFSLHGLSKLAGLPQLKLAFICLAGTAAARAEARVRLEWIADAFLSVSTPVQLALPAILAAHAPLAAAIRARLRANYDRLQHVCRDRAVTPLHVEGGWYATVRMPAVLDDEAWALELLEHESVLTQPGYFYDFADGPYLVLSLITPERRFEQGLERLLACVERVVKVNG